jgi:small GTP-binding protein
MSKFKSGFVTIIGRPNVGKSTLLNKVMGEKLSIISNRPQTTRNTIQAIYNHEGCQIVFLDTPGMHKPRHKLGEYMVKVAQNTLNEVDLILFLINPEDMITDQPEKFIISEIIREKILYNLKDEIPHGTAVEIMSMKEDKDTNTINIVATIYCEKDSHKAIIIGKGGQMLKKIGSLSRLDIEKLLGNHVFLELWVKVKKDWRDSVSILKNLGYQ